MDEKFSTRARLQLVPVSEELEGNETLQSVTWLVHPAPEECPSWFERAHWCKDLSDAIQHLHVNGLIHGNLKSSNCILYVVSLLSSTHSEDSLAQYQSSVFTFSGRHRPTRDRHETDTTLEHRYKELNLNSGTEMTDSPTLTENTALADWEKRVSTRSFD